VLSRHRALDNDLLLPRLLEGSFEATTKEMPFLAHHTAAASGASPSADAANHGVAPRAASRFTEGSMSKLGFLALACGLGSAFPVHAKPIDIELPYGEFGHLAQALADSCLSTSMANSFRFLDMHYSTTYDSKLTGKTDADLAAARDKLRDGYTLPDGTKRSGTGCPSSKFSFKQIWEAKVDYIGDFAPKTTVFAGMQKIDTITGKDLDTTGWKLGDKITKANPSFEFLLSELEHREDIEFGWRGGGFDHEMTLTSIHLDDKNDNRKLDAGEEAWIDYIDPAKPTKTFKGLGLKLKDGFLTFTYDNGTKKIEEVQIYSVYSESPIPEPTTVALLAVGIAALAARRRSIAAMMAP
jgi:hypothetical protein